ncbi:MAG: DUF2752 domain-containing protein [Clostridia bacterium]|nr:DUF2752 domain-containing protein [Clostridia bacterium]
MNRVKNIIILIGILVFFILLFVINIPMPCLFKTWLGISCPTCGFTRSVQELLSGNIMNSLRYNILTIPLIIFVIVTFIYVFIDVINNTKNYITLMNKLLKKYWIVIFIILLIIMIINNIRVI